jgi:hypothetical protein
MDFSIGSRLKEDKLGPDKLYIAGEIKTPEEKEMNFAKTFCNFGCKSCFVGEKKRKRLGARHNSCSVVRQLYNYMLLNGLFFGLYSNHDNMAGFIRDCNGTLMITPCITYNQKEPYTATQFIVLFYMLARMKELPTLLIEATNGVLVPCDGKGACKGEVNAHVKVPAACSVKDDPGKPSTNNDQVDTSKHFFSPSDKDSATSVVDIAFTGSLPSGRTGSTRRASLGGENVVIKIADIFKHPEIEDELDHEALVYDRMVSLQGTVIPKLVSQGRFAEEFLCGLATSDEGCDANSFEPDENFRRDAVEALGKIHSLGIIHGDIKRGNILKAKDGRPVIIDFGNAQLGLNADTLKRQQIEELKLLDAVLR